MTRTKWTIYIPEFFSPTEPQQEILEAIAEIDTGLADSEADLLARVGRADAVLLTDRTRMTREIIASSPRLRLICKYGVGTDQIDIVAATERGIPVINVPGMNANAVAELTIGLILAVMREIQEAKPLIAGGGWRDISFLGGELRGSRVGIIGYGNIARQVIRKLQGFEVQDIAVFSATRSGEVPEFPNVAFVDLPTLLKESDIVSIHKSPTPQTKLIMGASELGLMKKTAYLINTSRGSLVDEAALARALREGRIAGAALDVFAVEPLPPDHPFLSLRHLVLTPHVGSSGRLSRQLMVTAAARNIADFLQGKKLDPRCIVNPKVFTKTSHG